MSNHSIIEHRASYYFIRIEEDFLAICSNGKCSPHCKALILAILEHWINTKHAKDEGDYVYLTIPQWIRHTYMLYERNVIIACLHELLEEGLIMRRPFKIYNQETFEYTLNIDAIHKRLKSLPAKPSKETMPNLDPYLEYKARTKKAREDEKAKGEKVVEKSTAPVEKSTTPIEKSTRVVEKSTRVVEKSIQHRIRTQIPDSTSSLNSGRTDVEPQRKANTTTECKSSRSFARSEKEEEILLTEGGQRIYDFACESKLFKTRRPKITPKLKEECEELAEHIKTFEQFLSLLQSVQSNPKIKAPYHLKNMINALNAWGQLQEKTASPAMATTVPSEQPEKPKQITNLLELYKMQEMRRREEAAQREGSAI